MALVREKEHLLRNVEQNLTDYVEAVDALIRIGVIALLRAKARPHRHDRGADQNIMASEASYYAGCNDIIDELLEIKENYFLNRDGGPERPPLTYGAIDALLEKGEITKEEADDLRAGNTHKYDLSAHTRNIKNPTKPES